MAEYLLLFRGGDAARAEMQKSPEQSQAHMQKWVQWMGELSKKGKFVGAQPLKVAGKQIKGNRKIVTDGPFVEGKEMVGGYLICKADTIEEAVEISKDCPVLEHDGVVEVREIGELKM